MKSTALEYLTKINSIEGNQKKDLNQTKIELEQIIESYADNPAFQAFLEMQRISKLGE